MKNPFVKVEDKEPCYQCGVRVWNLDKERYECDCGAHDWVDPQSESEVDTYDPYRDQVCPGCGERGIEWCHC